MKRKILLLTLLWLIFFNPGGITNIDTERRMQMAHAWWTGTEEGIAGDRLVININGKNYVPYDLGQSMLMLPGDWLGAKLGQNLSNQYERQKFTEAIVSFFIFLPLNLLAVLACLRLLKLFGYSERISGLSAMVWLLGSSVLYYTALHQQNNQILLFVLVSYGNALAYATKEKKQWAILSGMALGIAFLIRITSILHAISVLIFLLGCVTYQAKLKKNTTQTIVEGLKSILLWMSGFLPVVLLERILTYYRYGSWTATSISLHLQAFSQRNSNNNPDAIVEGNNQGFFFLDLLTKIKLEALFAPLFSPEKSIFLYDPLVLPCLILSFICWRFLVPQSKWYLIAGTVNFLMHLYIYSWTREWIVDGYWGPRYHITSIHLLLVPLIPLLIQGAIKQLKIINNKVNLIQVTCSWIAKSVIVVAILIQFSSMMLSVSLETTQQDLGIGSRLRLIQRIQNIFYVANYEKNPNPVLTQVIEKKPTPGFVINNKISWEILPFRLDNRLSNNSSLKKFMPILLFLWAVIFVAAITTTVWIFIKP